MNRKDFLKKGVGFLGTVAMVPTLLASKPYTENLLACSTTNSETAGPFPTISPANYERTNIVGDRTGVAFTINITINNVNANCTSLEGALVDIWHCDKDGYYSQYGGTQMQSVNYTNNNFLRGRQITDSNGLVSFTSIFPGWYTSRATHIHVHIYNENGTSLLVTQIAFPESANSAVVQVNSATAYGYTKGMTGYTYNSTDNVFSDGVSSELSTVTGSVANGFTLEHTIYVNGSTLSVGEINEGIGNVAPLLPNPFSANTILPITLKYSSKIKLEIYDITGKLVSKPVSCNFSPGLNSLNINRGDLSSGAYILKIFIKNDQGIFTTSKKLLIN